jgi:predicted transcriptional regulator
MTLTFAEVLQEVTALQRITRREELQPQDLTVQRFMNSVNISRQQAQHILHSLWKQGKLDRVPTRNEDGNPIYAYRLKEQDAKSIKRRTTRKS